MAPRLLLLATAVRSNIPVKVTPAFSLRWTLRDKAPRSALYLQR